jgi:hypothetical protein
MGARLEGWGGSGCKCVERRESLQVGGAAGLDGGYNGDDSGTGVGSAAGASPGIGFNLIPSYSWTGYYLYVPLGIPYDMIPFLIGSDALGVGTQIDNDYQNFRINVQNGFTVVDNDGIPLIAGGPAPRPPATPTIKQQIHAALEAYQDCMGEELPAALPKAQIEAQNDAYHEQANKLITTPPTSGGEGGGPEDMINIPMSGPSATDYLAAAAKGFTEASYVCRNKNPLAVLDPQYNGVPVDFSPSPWWLP